MIPRTLFTFEHETFRDSVRRFMETEVKPQDERWQEQGYGDAARTRSGLRRHRKGRDAERRRSE